MKQQLPHRETDHLRSSSIRPRRVLVVEDDKNLTVLIGYALFELSADVEVDWATSFEAAMKRFVISSQKHKQAPYDLLVVDIFLEGKGNGFDLIKVIHRMYPMMSFLIVTSLNYDVVKENLSELQTSNISYLKKPFLYSDCKYEIRQLFKISHFIEGEPYESKSKNDNSVRYIR